MPRKRKPKLGLLGRIILAPLNATAKTLQIATKVNKTISAQAARDRRDLSSRKPWHAPRKPAKKKQWWDT